MRDRRYIEIFDKFRHLTSVASDEQLKEWGNSDERIKEIKIERGKWIFESNQKGVEIAKHIFIKRFLNITQIIALTFFVLCALGLCCALYDSIVTNTYQNSYIPIAGGFGGCGLVFAMVFIVVYEYKGDIFRNYKKGKFIKTIPKNVMSHIKLLLFIEFIAMFVCVCLHITLYFCGENFNLWMYPSFLLLVLVCFLLAVYVFYPLSERFLD